MTITGEHLHDDIGSFEIDTVADRLYEAAYEYVGELIVNRPEIMVPPDYRTAASGEVVDVIDHGYSENGYRVRDVYVSDPLYQAGGEVRDYIRDFERQLTDRAVEIGSEHVDINFDKGIKDLNPVAQRFYAEPVMNAWLPSVPSARALEYLYNPGLIQGILSEAGLEGSREQIALHSLMFQHWTDPHHIRMRAVGVRHFLSEIYGDHFKNFDRVNGHEHNILSLGSGIAQPIFQEMERLRGTDERTAEIKATLVDWDKSALSRSIEFGESLGFEHGRDFNTVRGNFLSFRYLGKISAEAHLAAEMTGVWDYLDDEQAAQIVKIAMTALGEDGVAIVACMLKETPGLNTNSLVINWPGIKHKNNDESAGVLINKVGIKPENIIANNIISADSPDGAVNAVYTAAK